MTSPASRVVVTSLHADPLASQRPQKSNEKPGATWSVPQSHGSPGPTVTRAPARAAIRLADKSSPSDLSKIDAFWKSVGHNRQAGATAGVGRRECILCEGADEKVVGLSDLVFRGTPGNMVAHCSVALHPDVHAEALDSKLMNWTFTQAIVSGCRELRASALDESGALLLRRHHFRFDPATKEFVFPLPGSQPPAKL